MYVRVTVYVHATVVDSFSRCMLMKEWTEAPAWDVSVVLLTQLSLLTATHGSLVLDNLLSEDCLGGCTCVMLGPMQ